MRTFLCWHLGLGDALLCCGLVRALVSEGRSLTLPVQPQYEASLIDLFFDLIQDGLVKLNVVAGDPYEVPKNHEVIRIGHHADNFDFANWDQSFYTQANVSPWAMTNLFKIGRHPEAGIGAWPDVFVHDDMSRGYLIDRSGFRPRQSASIFDHITPLLFCNQFHGINSCFAILLALAMPAKPEKYIYDIRPEPLPRIFLGNNWTIRRP